jgi:hypothetical protein
MHAVVVRVEIDSTRFDEAEKLLHGTVVPTVKSLEGFVRGLWLHASDGRGRGVIVFDSEEHAHAAAEQVPRPPEGGPVTFQGAEVVEVVAEA